jgi:hypothetical protein
MQVIKHDAAIHESVLEHLGMSLVASDSISTALPYLLALQIMFHDHCQEMETRTAAVQVGPSECCVLCAFHAPYD